MAKFICILVLAIVFMIGGYLMAEYTDMEEGGVMLFCGGVIFLFLSGLAFSLI